MGHMAPIRARLGYMRSGWQSLDEWCVNCEFELVHLWLGAAILEPDSILCFNDTVVQGWCGCVVWACAVKEFIVV